jgi:hypothetical protein
MATFEEELAAYLGTAEMQKAIKAHIKATGGTGGTGTEESVRQYAQEAVKAIIASLPASLTRPDTEGNCQGKSSYNVGKQGISLSDFMIFGWV